MKKELDFSKTLPYVLKHVKGGCILGENIIQNIPFNKGHFFIFLPEHAKIEQLYQFSAGGINPVVSSNEVHCIDGKEFKPNSRITTSWEVSGFIKQFLDKNTKHLAICEDAIQLKGDPPQEIPNTTLCFYGEQTYYILSHKSSIDDIYGAIRRTDNIWHSLIVLSSGVLHQDLQAEDFSSLCDNAQYVLTSAHDGENFILWENSSRLLSKQV